jgi:hypothetical protein
LWRVPETYSQLYTQWPQTNKCAWWRKIVSNGLMHLARAFYKIKADFRLVTAEGAFKTKDYILSTFEHLAFEVGENAAELARQCLPQSAFYMFSGI